MLLTSHVGRSPKRKYYQWRNKSCELDIISTELLEEILPSCIEIITHIVNISLTKGLFANDWKTAIVHLLLKKPGNDLLKNNYRSVSNLNLLCKLVECCMLKHLISHYNTYSFIPDFQSAYRENYSTETSLIKMCNNILWSMEKQQITMMATLDLSSAFNMVDHNILLNSLQNHYGNTDKALQCFNNYLQPWQFKVSIRNNYLKPPAITL